MSPRPRREERHPDLQTAIKETAWKQIAELGTAALNLHAIARDLGITGPSIYNYVPNCDALITALIVDAFASLADAQATAITALPEQEYAQCLLALGINYREWAMVNPERYQLIFGTPLAGYVAPLDNTLPVAGRSLTILMNALMAAHTARKLRPEMGRALSPKTQAMFADWQPQRGAANQQVQFLALSIWGHVHGLVSVEIGQQYPLLITEPGEIYRYMLELLIIRYFPVSK